MLMFRTMSSRPEGEPSVGAACALQGFAAIAVLGALLLGTTSAAAQATPGAALPERTGSEIGVGAGSVRGATNTARPAGATEAGATASDIDPGEAPLVAGMLQDEALHRDRLGRIHRLRRLAAEGNQRERLAQLDDLELRETRRHEAAVVRDRSLLSERSARGVDDFVKRGGLYRARGKDIAIARQRKFGANGDDVVRRGENADRNPERRATRTGTGTSRSSGSASRGGGSSGGSSRGGSRGGGPR